MRFFIRTTEVVGGFNRSSPHLDEIEVNGDTREETAAGDSRECQTAVAVARALRPPMRSPGRPEPSRAIQREFWRLIATGKTTVEVSADVGVSTLVGVRWFRHADGIPPLSLDEPTGRYLSFPERE